MTTRTLATAHQTKLAMIAPNVIAERGYTSFSSPQEMKKIAPHWVDLWDTKAHKKGSPSIPTKIKSLLPALFIPLYQLGNNNGHVITRPDNPRIDAKGRTVKYEYPPNVKPVLDVLPRYTNELLDANGRALWFTEGAIKADTLVSLHGFDGIPINVNGVRGWQSAGGAVADFQGIQVQGRRVVLCFDSDYSTNPDVAKAVNALAYYLGGRGAIVSLCLLPAPATGGKIGVDDYIDAGHTFDDLNALLQPYAPQQKASAQPKQKVMEMCKEWAKRNDIWAYNPTNDSFYFWAATHWKQASPTDLTRHIAMLCIGQDVDYSRTTQSNVEALAKPLLEQPFTRRAGLANFRNGTFSLATGTLQPHDPLDHLDYCLPFDFDINGDCSAIQAFIDETISDPVARHTYMAHIGFALLGDTTRHGFLFLHGKRRGGKGTAMALAQYLCGSSESDAFNFAGATLFSPDTEGKRSRAKWVNRSVVCVDELATDALLKGEEELKRMSAHSGAEMRLIGKDEQVSNRWLPKIIIASNDTPRFLDTSGAILKSRLYPILYTKSFEGKESWDLLDTLIPQAGAFASLCVGLAFMLYKAGLGLPLSGGMVAARSSYSTQNPLNDFISEHCIIDSTARVPSSDLYQSYLDYCLESGVTKLSKHSFTARLRDGHNVSDVRMHDAFTQKTVRGYSGIRLRTESDPAQNLYTSVHSLTEYEQSVQGFLGDWKALKQAFLYTCTLNLVNSSRPNYDQFAQFYSDSQIDYDISRMPAQSVQDVHNGDLDDSDGLNPSVHFFDESVQESENSQYDLFPDEIEEGTSPIVERLILPELPDDVYDDAAVMINNGRFAEYRALRQKYDAFNFEDLDQRFHHTERLWTADKH